MGSSDIYKNATKLVMLSGGSESKHPHLRETYIHASKNRIKGSVKHYIAKVIYNTLTNSYEPQLILGQYRPGMTEFVPMKSEWPKWVK